MLRRRRPPLAELRASRVALIKPSALGDVVHALPVLSALRHKFPDAHIAWIVNRSYQPLIDGHVALNETIAFDRSALKGGWRKAAGASLSRELTGAEDEELVDFAWRQVHGQYLTGLRRSAAHATGRRSCDSRKTPRIRPDRGP